MRRQKEMMRQRSSCGPVNGKEKIGVLLQQLQPGTRDVTEQSTWSPHGCSCGCLELRMGTALEWLSR